MGAEHLADKIYTRISGGKKVALLDQSGLLNFGMAEEMITEERLSDLYDAPIRVFFSEEMGRTVCLTGKTVING